MQGQSHLRFPSTGPPSPLLGLSLAHLSSLTASRLSVRGLSLRQGPTPQSLSRTQLESDRG